MKTVDDVGDDSGLRWERTKSSTVLVTVLVHRNGQEDGEKAARLLIPYKKEN